MMDHGKTSLFIWLAQKKNTHYHPPNIDHPMSWGLGDYFPFGYVQGRTVNLLEGHPSEISLSYADNI
jgi:hypothetical protein